MHTHRPQQPAAGLAVIHDDPTTSDSSRTTGTTDPGSRLTAQLAHVTALRWEAVLDYRAAMAVRGETVLLALYGGELDHFIRLVGTPVGGELVILGRDGAAGRLWDAVPGEDVAAAIGETVLHGLGTSLDAWQVCGRFRRITSVAHPNTPAEPVHVLHRLDGPAR